ncbi:MAG: hypothetical protein K9G61_01035 [Bacteroidales bacterium]|nr:hypothetical protein [Bacteroidales bacterium]
MRLIIAFMLFIPLFCSSQNCDECNIEYQIISRNGCYSSIKQIKKNEIELYKSYCNEPNYYKPTDYIIIKNGDSLEKTLFEKYPDNFKKSENGFDFIDANGNKTKIQKLMPEDIKSRQVYKIKAIISGYILVYVTGYEWWYYQLFDIKRFKQYTLPGAPVFINPDFLYGYTDYYGSGEIKFIDTKNDRDVHLLFGESISNVGHSSNPSMGTLLNFNHTKCKDTIYFNIVNQ